LKCLPGTNTSAYCKHYLTTDAKRFITLGPGTNVFKNSFLNNLQIGQIN
jgi:hypothetical protein